jgi:Protein of unknown function (DUF2637)
MTKFRHLPAAGRAIIIVVAVGVLAIAVVACATSYNAIYRLVGQLGLYGYRINQAFPLLLDAAFLVAELAAILGGIMRAVTRSDEVSQGWPGTAMVLCGLGTIGFNVGHAYLLGGRGDPLTVWRCVVAALPPVLMMVSFQVLLAIVKWVMLHLGRPLNSAAALTPTPGYGMVPPAGPYGLFPPHPVFGQAPSVGQQGAGQNGHGELPEPTKRAAVELYLSRLSPQELGVTTGSSIVAALAGQGMAVEETYAGRVLGEWRVSHSAPDGSRKRGSRGR